MLRLYYSCEARFDSKKDKEQSLKKKIFWCKESQFSSSQISRHLTSGVWRAVYTRNRFLSFTAASLSAITKHSIFMLESCTQQSGLRLCLNFLLDFSKKHWYNHCITFEDHHIRTMMTWLHPNFILTIIFLTRFQPQLKSELKGSILKNHQASCIEETKKTFCLTNLFYYRVWETPRALFIRTT